MNAFDIIENSEIIKKKYGGYKRKIADCLAHRVKCNYVVLEIKTQNLWKAKVQLDDFVRRLKDLGLKINEVIVVLERVGRNRKAFEFRKTDRKGLYYLMSKGIKGSFIRAADIPIMVYVKRGL